MLWRNVLSAKVNDSMIFRDSMSPEDEDMANVSAEFRTAIKAVGKSSENMSSRIYNFSTM